MRFLLVDDIIEMIPGRSVQAVKTLTRTEELFRDHFPGFEVVPGVLLIEMMAQAAGKCLDAGDPARGKAMLVQVKNAAFRHWVRPDERVHIHARIIDHRSDSATASCWLAVNDREVATATLLFAFLPLTEFASSFRDEVLERYRQRKVTGNTQEHG